MITIMFPKNDILKNEIPMGKRPFGILTEHFADYLLLLTCPKIEFKLQHPSSIFKTSLFMI